MKMKILDLTNLMSCCNCQCKQVYIRVTVRAGYSNRIYDFIVKTVIPKLVS